MLRSISGHAYYKKNENINNNKFYLINCYLTLVKLKNDNLDEIDIDILYQLGLHYENISKIKACGYYKIAANKNHLNSAKGLVALEANFEERTKYIKICAELNDTSSMIRLAEIYDNSKNYKYMAKYYLMAMDNGNFSGLTTLFKYYNINDKYDQLLKIYIKYFKTAGLSITGLIKALNNYFSLNYEVDNELINLIVNTDFGTNDVPVFIKTIKAMASKELNMIKLHFDFAPGSNGFVEAKEHFMDYLQKNKKT